MGKVYICRCGTQGADDAAVKGYLGGEVGQMEVPLIRQI